MGWVPFARFHSSIGGWHAWGLGTVHLPPLLCALQLQTRACSSQRQRRWLRGGPRYASDKTDGTPRPCSSWQASIVLPRIVVPKGIDKGPPSSHSKPTPVRAPVSWSRAEPTSSVAGNVAQVVTNPLVVAGSPRGAHRLRAGSERRCCRCGREARSDIRMNSGINTNGRGEMQDMR